jgi:hypothetical protein
VGIQEITSDASRIAEHRLKKWETEKSRGEKEKAFCNVMLHERIKKKKKTRMTSKN